MLHEFVRLILEGRWERETGIISRALMRKIVQFVSDAPTGVEIWPPTHVDVSDLVGLGLRTTLILSMTHDLKTDISAEFDPEFMSLDIAVTVNVADGRRGLSTVAALLSDVVRHEIEHMVQVGLIGPRPQGGATSLDYEVGQNYRAAPHEIEAWAVGLYRQAKHRKVPFTELLRQSLTSADGFDQEIYDKTLDYARRRFPKLR